MKQAISQLKTKFTAIVASAFIVAGCASIHESPTRTGYCVVTMPGMQVGVGKYSAHAVLGYYHFNFDGGGGHNNFYQAGGQVRRELSPTPEKGPWVAVEASYIYISNKIDNVDSKPNASAFAVGPGLGYRFQLGKVPFNIYGVASYFSRGAFDSYGDGANGFLGRFAFDIPFTSMFSKRGR